MKYTKKEKTIDVLLSFLICFGLFVFVSSCHAQQDPTPVNPEDIKFIETVKSTIDSSVSIIMVGDTENGRCSGVVLQNDTETTTVLTAKHCVGMQSEIYVENILVIDVRFSLTDDLALLVLQKHLDNKKPANLSKNGGNRFDIVYHIGYPTNNLYIETGYIFLTAIKDQYAELKVISGCSGGGIFNKEGELIGIVWGSTFDNTTTIFSPLNDIIKFLESIK